MLWLVLGLAMSAAQLPTGLRFHHIHIGVADPAAAMNEAADRLQGERLILQGHGPAVRAGSAYLVFDRMDSTSAGPRIAAVAFASADLQFTLESLRAKGIDPVERTSDTARYRVSPELYVEIVSETDRPDTHWCPMHPAARAPGASTCPICRMDMVPIPAPRVGEYVLDVVTTHAPRKGGAIGLRLIVRDRHDGSAITNFVEVHERSFHLFIVSRDLKTFVHAHPEQRDGGVFVLEQALEPGEYMLIADFLPAGGTPQVVHRAIVTPGHTGPLFNDPPKLAVSPAEQTIDGLRVKLVATDVTALRPASLRFVVSDATTGAEVRDLEPYLGASGHLLIVNGSLTSALHGHPTGTQTAGPEILFDPVLPKAGMYKLWLQFQRKGRIVTVPFVIEVAPL